MHKKFSEAMLLLQTSAASKKDSKATSVAVDETQARVFIDCLNIMGYLNEDLLGQAIEDLSLSKPFTDAEGRAVSNDTVKKDLFAALAKARAAGDKFVDVFFEEFAAEDYFKVTDILEIITYLCQTAYNREYGQERSQHGITPGQPWMKVASLIKQFLQHADNLGLMKPIAPKAGHYCGIAIMGAASGRVGSRLDYFLTQVKPNESITYDDLFALTGYRRLSKDLDSQALMEEMAGGPELLEYEEAVVGTTKRQFAKKKTEEGTMDLLEVGMVDFLIQKKAPKDTEKVRVIDSKKLAANTRATTEDSAKDIAALLATAIAEKTIKLNDDGTYRFMIIAEQPFLQRMTYQIQRAFNTQLAEVEGVRVIVSGSGRGMSNPDDITKDSLAGNVSSLFNIAAEMASGQFERLSDVRKKFPDLEWRDPSHIIFNQRKAACEKARAAQKAASLAATSAPSAVDGPAASASSAADSQAAVLAVDPAVRLVVEIPEDGTSSALDSPADVTTPTADDTMHDPNSPRTVLVCDVPRADTPPPDTLPTDLLDAPADSPRASAAPSADINFIDTTLPILTVSPTASRSPSPPASPTGISVADEPSLSLAAAAGTFGILAQPKTPTASEIESTLEVTRESEESHPGEGLLRNGQR